jgi:hypothetical protein
MWFTQPTEELKMYRHQKDRKDIEIAIANLTGRPGLFSKHAKERGRAVESLLRQILSETLEQYREGRIYAQYDDSSAKNFFKQFGIVG